MIKRFFIQLLIIFSPLSVLSQEYIEVLRAADNNILVNPALAGIDGRSSLSRY